MNQSRINGRDDSILERFLQYIIGVIYLIYVYPYFPFLQCLQKWSVTLQLSES